VFWRIDIIKCNAPDHVDVNYVSVEVMYYNIGDISGRRKRLAENMV